jgi:hypothetical protein
VSEVRVGERKLARLYLPPFQHRCSQCLYQPWDIKYLAKVDVGWLDSEADKNVCRSEERQYWNAFSQYSEVDEIYLGQDECKGVPEKRDIRMS